MNITNIKVRQIKKEESKVRGLVSITIDDCFVVHGIRIIEGNEKLFLAMPSRRNNDGEYIDMAYPINSETREMIEAKVLDRYNSLFGESEK